jgi:fatty acid desaturase
MQAARDYSLLGEDGRRAVESGLAMADWYRSPVPRKRMKELMQRRDGPAIRDTIIWLGSMVVIGGLACHLWFSGWSVLLFAIYGVLYCAAFSRWHECGHGTAFKTRWMNTGVYNVASFMILRDPTMWRWSHIRHHTDTIIVGRDREIAAMRPPRIGRILLNLVGLTEAPRGFASMFVHASGRLSAEDASYVPESERTKIYWTARAWLLLYSLVFVACFAFWSILPALLIGLPLIYGMWHEATVGLTQHAGLAENVTDHRLNTRTVYMNPITRFLYWNMNYHLEHHMFPMVPYHRLKDLHEEIKADLPSTSPSIVAAYREFLPAMLRQRRDPSYYIDRRRLIPSAS